MKMVVQNFKTGELSINDSPTPRASAESILVQTRVSLISAGTDRAIIGMAKKNYLGKALDRPDLARKVINKAKTDGLWATYKVVKNLIAEPIPLGYSLVGEVIAVGKNITDVLVGDRVACAGLGYANHAEFVTVPRNLFVPVPSGIEDEQAAYVTLGAIAMHGVRQADQQFGATVLVVGLGLLGQITTQLCNAAGYRVIGLDLDLRKLALAKQNGALLAYLPNDPNFAAAVAQLTDGHGVDAVLLTAGSRESGEIFEQVAAVCRDRARVVVVGDIKMDISRRTYFQKELEILQSRSYGPGRYDANYEEKGQDYPIGYVRWTERRNMQAFLSLIADKKINMSSLTTHQYSLDEAERAYELITGKSKELTVGILLNYDKEIQPSKIVKVTTEKNKVTGKIKLGVIGTGNFAKAILLPALMETKNFEIIGVASARGISAKSIAERYQARYSTCEAQQILDDPEVNAVIIATRHDSHGKYVIEALKRNKHVFVEKPLCLTWDELGEVEEVAAQSKGTLMVGYNRRFSPLMLQLKNHFQGRSEPLSMIYRINAGRIPLIGEGSWVHDPSIGGGRIIGEGCHFVDALQFLCDAEPTSVTASSINLQRSDLSQTDTVTMTINFADGSMGTIHYFTNGDKSHPKEYIEVFSQEKIGILDNFRKLKLVANNKTTKKSTLNLEKGYSEEAKIFEEMCHSGKQIIPLTTIFNVTKVTLSVMDCLLGSEN